jgi:hypothetical protein
MKCQLAWEHIGLPGDYVWSTADESPTSSGRCAATNRFWQFAIHALSSLSYTQATIVQ